MRISDNMTLMENIWGETCQGYFSWDKPGQDLPRHAHCLKLGTHEFDCLYSLGMVLHRGPRLSRRCVSLGIDTFVNWSLIWCILCDGQSQKKCLKAWHKVNTFFHPLSFLVIDLTTFHSLFMANTRSKHNNVNIPSKESHKGYTRKSNFWDSGAHDRVFVYT